MDFSTIVDKIGQRIKRPEKTTDIQDAVNNAIETASINGEFANDLVEGNVAIDPTLIAQSIVISSTMPNFRKVKYLRPNCFNKFLTWKDPAKLLDQNRKVTETNCWYRAGDSLVFRLSETTDKIYYGYYTFPVRLTLDADTHWMFDFMFTAIFNLAIGEMWRDIGNMEEANKAEAKGMAAILAHRRDHQDGNTN